MAVRAIAFSILLFAAVPTRSDWSSCSSDLRRVQRATRDAADLADGLDSKKEEVESKKREYDDATDKLSRCRRYGGAYDSYSDSCATLRRRAQDAKSEYDTARDAYEQDQQQLQSAMDEVWRYAKRTETSCAPDYSASVADAPTICASLKSLKGQYSETDLLAACKMRLPEAVCRSCLGLQ